MFFIFFFHFLKKKVSSFLFSCISFKYFFIAGVSVRVQLFPSVVGAPWRCGVLTTWGGIAGIGLGRLLGGEHASTPQSGVEAPRLLKRSLTRLYYCCCSRHFMTCVCPQHVCACKASRLLYRANLKAWVRALHGIQPIPVLS